MSTTPQPPYENTLSDELARVKEELTTMTRERDELQHQINEAIELLNLAKPIREKDIADKATLVEALKNGATAGADNMEGEDARGFEYWEGHMKFCTDLLQKVGVNYNPITGETSPKH